MIELLVDKPFAHTYVWDAELAVLAKGYYQYQEKALSYEREPWSYRRSLCGWCKTNHSRNHMIN